MREQAIGLLGNGATREDVLKITGAPEDLFAEWLKDKDFLEAVRAARAEKREEVIEDSYAKLEESTLKKIKDNIEMADVPTLCRVLETTAKNRVLRRAPANHYTNPTANLTITVNLPQGAQNAGITLDQSTGQILAIGDRNMAPMPLTGVTKLFRQLDKAEETKKSEESACETLESTRQDDKTALELELDRLAARGIEYGNARTVQQHAQREAQDDTRPVEAKARAVA